MPIFEQNHFLHGWKCFLDSRHSPRSLKCLCKNIRGFAGFSIRTVSTMVAEQFNPENFQPRNCPRNCPGIVPELSRNCPGIVLELPQKSLPKSFPKNAQKEKFFLESKVQIIQVRFFQQPFSRASLSRAKMSSFRTES